MFSAGSFDAAFCWRLNGPKNDSPINPFHEKLHERFARSCFYMDHSGFPESFNMTQFTAKCAVRPRSAAKTVYACVGASGLRGSICLLLARNARDAGGRRCARSARGRWSAGRSGHACSGWEIRPTFGAYSIERGVIEATIRALQIRAGIGWSKTHFFLLSFASLLKDCLQNTFVLYSPSPHRTIGRSC